MNPEGSVGTKTCCVSATGNLIVKGWIEGEIDVENDLTVEPGSQVAAQIAARVATIKGTVHGNVTAREKVVLVGAGSLQGDIVTPRLIIDDGGCFIGTVNRHSANGNGDVVDGGGRVSQ